MADRGPIEARPLPAPARPQRIKLSGWRSETPRYPGGRRCVRGPVGAGAQERASLQEGSGSIPSLPNDGLDGSEAGREIHLTICTIGGMLKPWISNVNCSQDTYREPYAV